MPLFTASISPSKGAVLAARIGPASEARAAAQSAGQPLCGPIDVRLLIDTGCSHTSIRPEVARNLGILASDSTRIQTPSHHDVAADVYRVRLAVGPLVAIDDLAAVETPLVGQDIDGLLGRDVLRHAMLLYHGPDESWTVAF